MPNTIGRFDPAHLHHSCEHLPEISTPEGFGEVLDAVLDEQSGKWETLAHELKIDTSLLSKWTRGSKNPMPAWRLIPFTKRISDSLLRAIAEECGYDLVPKKKASSRLAS